MSKYCLHSNDMYCACHYCPEGCGYCNEEDCNEPFNNMCRAMNSEEEK